MELTDNDYLAIFDLELNKFAREHPNQKILAIVCRKAKMTEINYGKIDGIEAVATETIKEIKQLIKE